MNESPDADPPAVFEKVFQDERAEIRKRRNRWGGDLPDNAVPDDLKGLALSGGGIRSATFCLGVLQGLYGAGVLSQFDYLSTVSGGGFVGGWWSAWLSRTARNTEPDAAAAIFPGKEGIEPQRSAWSPAATDSDVAAKEVANEKEGSRCAGVDPIHHLRLFANYLTPRKGALSADTWRAITVGTRNLLLTFVMLVPLLAAAILAAQLYFVGNQRLAVSFVCGPPDVSTPASPPGTGRNEAACRTFSRQDTIPASAGDARGLKLRAAQVMVPLLVLAGWTLLATGLWVWFGTRRLILSLVTCAGVILMIYFAVSQMARGTASILRTEVLEDKWFLPLLVGGSLLILGYAVVLLGNRLVAAKRTTRHFRLSSDQIDVLTNRMTKLQSALLVALAVVGVVLGVAGFGHELFEYLFRQTHEGIEQYVARIGGWAAALITLGSAVMTWFRAAPKGGADSRGSGKSTWEALLFAVAPALVLAALMLLLTAATHAWLGTLVLPDRGAMQPLHVALLAAGALGVLVAFYELWTEADGSDARRWLILLAAIAAGVAVAWIEPFSIKPQYVAAIVVLAGGLTLWSWVASSGSTTQEDAAISTTLESPAAATAAAPGEPAPPEGRSLRRDVFIGVLVALAALAAWLLRQKIGIAPAALGHGHPIVARLALAGLVVATVSLVLFAILYRRAANRRVMGLLTGVVLLLAVLFHQQFLNPEAPQVFFPAAIVALVGTLLAWVVGVGWLLDPNYVSLHMFYRARLVRAYLGASNPNRRGAEITKSADRDDVPLHQLANCAHGAPYHLINTTLNLAGGRDLVTAQRSAAYFTMSKLYTGSLRTRYRPTQQYMDGTLSLGTAVAVSGAAASPNMGAKTPSAALAMLLALLNVRLGFWAPTPNEPRWTSPRARLWPFYLLREFLSQTTDLSNYCYLTDGGHFDNTGLYSLVQRGCRTIMLIDCGADPGPCFADLGDAIRRCRIDFGADISVSVRKFSRKAGKWASRTHFAVGEITYSPEHLERLGWPASRARDFKGTLVWIKPSLLRKDPAEVLQYALENRTFPQQTTADQWFDEAQFESYRRLGKACVEAALLNAEVRQVFPLPAVVPSDRATGVEA